MSKQMKDRPEWLEITLSTRLEVHALYKIMEYYLESQGQVDTPAMRLAHGISSYIQKASDEPPQG